MQPFTVHKGTIAPLRRSDVDTDQIVPARFCTNATRTGYADALFADWRRDPSFVLNRAEHRGATILVAGENFGTGSSREAAVWALQNYGFRAVISPRFGDIFRANALMSGLLAVTVPAGVVHELWRAAERGAAEPVTVDLERLRLCWGDRSEPFDLEPDIRSRLLCGLDPIEATLRDAGEIARYEARRRPALPRSVPAAVGGRP